MNEITTESTEIKHIYSGALVERDHPLSPRTNQVYVHRDADPEYGGFYVVAIEPDTRIIEILDSEVTEFCAALDKLLSVGHSVIQIKLAISGAVTLSTSRYRSSNSERMFDVRTKSWKDLGATRMYENAVEQILSAISNALPEEPLVLAS